jgi:ABC-type glycerol-3-phosphate transport system substrate-binding protein
MTGQTTRRKFLGQAATAAGVASAIAAAGMPSIAQAGVAAQAKVTGKFQVVLNLDFNANYNTFLKQTITDYAKSQSWDLDLSDLAGFLGSDPIYQKLQAQKAAGTPVDIIIHTLSGLLMDAYDLTTDVKSLVDKQVAKYGKVYGSARAGLLINNQWKALPFHDRTGGYWVRKDKFAAIGMSVANGDLDTWDKVKNAYGGLRPSQRLLWLGHDREPVRRRRNQCVGPLAELGRRADRSDGADRHALLARDDRRHELAEGHLQQPSQPGYAAAGG